MADARPDTATLAYLHSHGLDVRPRRLSRLVRAAVDALPRDLRPGEARRDLSPAEVQALERGGFDLSDRHLAEADPLVLTTVKYAAILEDSLSTAAAAAQLGVQPSRVRQRLTARPPTLYGIHVGSEWRIPRFQFQGKRLVPGMVDLLAVLDPSVHPVALYTWFLTPSPDLSLDGGGNGAEQRLLSPRQWLLAGYPVEPVVELAKSL